MKKKLTAFMILLCGIVLTAGVNLLFTACEPICKDGTAAYMNCHNAQLAVTGVGAAIALLGGLLAVTEKKLLNITAAFLAGAAGIAAAVLPNTAIKLCMMTDMHCHSVMRPAVTVVGVLTAVVSVVHIIIAIRSEER